MFIEYSNIADHMIAGVDSLQGGCRQNNSSAVSEADPNVVALAEAANIDLVVVLQELAD